MIVGVEFRFILLSNSVVLFLRSLRANLCVSAVSFSP